jgi:hypothetical protein
VAKIGSERDTIMVTAEHRYLFDAEFHAKVHTVVDVMQANTVGQMTPEDRSLASLAAAVMLQATEENPWRF